MDGVIFPNTDHAYSASIMLDGKIRFHHLAEGFLLGIFIFPTYFGIRLPGFDLTVLRLFELLLLFAILKSPVRKRQFFSLVFGTKYIWFILPYFIVLFVTNMYRGAWTGWLGPLFNYLVLFCVLLYLAVYHYTIEALGQKIVRYIWVLCLISPLQLIIGRAPFGFLDFLDKGTATERFGATRITGNCAVSNGYGLYLMLLLPFVCIDWKTKKINLLNNPVLLMLLLINAILTGSRLAIGAAALEMFLILLFSPRRVRNWGFFWGIFIAVISMSCLLMTQSFYFSRSILMTIFMAVDEVFGSSISTHYGANESALYGSTYYRELLVQGTFGDNWLNPIIGRGANYTFAMYLDGYLIQSVDNYYAGQYIHYAWPGVITFLYIGLRGLLTAIHNVQVRNTVFAKAVIVSLIGWYISLWYLDQLQTFPVAIALLSILCAENLQLTKNFALNLF